MAHRKRRDAGAASVVGATLMLALVVSLVPAALWLTSALRDAMRAPAERAARARRSQAGSRARPFRRRRRSSACASPRFHAKQT